LHRLETLLQLLEADYRCIVVIVGFLLLRFTTGLGLATSTIFLLVRTMIGRVPDFIAFEAFLISEELLIVGRLARFIISPPFSFSTLLCKRCALGRRCRQGLLWKLVEVDMSFLNSLRIFINLLCKILLERIS